MKKILFVTGTRADYGKIKSLMKRIEETPKFKLLIFVTGMHMLSKYGSTWTEIVKDGFKNVYQYINQKNQSDMDITLSNTILGLSNYVEEIKPDLIVVHGDRLEALAGAIVGSFNNIKVAHIEGGEVSGTIDESIRHAITKFSHIHLVSNERARQRVLQLGESNESIFIIGSPDIDIMLSDTLPNLDVVKERYEIFFNRYAIFMYHPVTTELNLLDKKVNLIIESLKKTGRNYIVIYPNNDPGSTSIINTYQQLEDELQFRVIPSMRFEYFLTLMKYAEFIIGNSSAGIMEAGVYGTPAIDIGNRQKGRYQIENMKNIVHVNEDKDEIIKAIEEVHLKKQENNIFGNGKSSEKFIKILNSEELWKINIQKKFIDTENY
ncbi:UDP-N-acetylglucosamine 2-epimerase [Massilibacterium senegalense]|uniref:UDP-N-acetylglucosamine 2-epimerase n=1 Tax=Massilibacterium senegalense TaxID=1632858 RepID=UPI0007866F2C|nr:UDP-N-acetylglucosamine 2-epimerase [Massilibacterium senegalense]